MARVFELRNSAYQTPDHGPRQNLTHSIWAMPQRALMAMFDALYAWQTRISEREHLRGLDDRLLSDMGLSRADVAHEADKPFWRT